MQFRPRKIDTEAMREARWAKEVAAIEAERRRRYQRTELEMGVEIKPPPGRPMGETDITDVPTSVPWQHRALTDLGELYPVRKNWVCPRCGQIKLGSFPDPRCSRCGFESPLRRINWRR